MAENPIGAVMVVGGGIAGMTSAKNLADQGFEVVLVEKEETQLEVGKINLIAHQIDIVICQKFISGKPGGFTAGTRFKYFHGFTN